MIGKKLSLDMCRNYGVDTPKVGFSLGEYISALLNSAAYVGQPYGYMLFGVNNVGHAFAVRQLCFPLLRFHGP